MFAVAVLMVVVVAVLIRCRLKTEIEDCEDEAQRHAAECAHLQEKIASKWLAVDSKLLRRGRAIRRGPLAS